MRHKATNSNKKERSAYIKYVHHKLYFTNTWRKLRAKKLSEKPLCKSCNHPANEVDHIIDHKGDRDIFYDYSNLQSLCKPCHSRKTMRTTNSYSFRSVEETITITITNNKSDLEDCKELLEVKEINDYVVETAIKTNNSLCFSVKSKLEAEKIKQGYILIKRVNPIFKIIQEVQHERNKKTN